MITVKDFMEVVDYKITEGSEYLWKCFGDNAHRLDCWSGAIDQTDSDGYTISIVFDTKKQIVYLFEAHDYRNHRSYRWFNPDTVDAYKAEVVKKLGSLEKDIAYDDVRFVELDLPEDMLTKARAIVLNTAYDTRVTIPIDLDDSEWYQLMLTAHKQDITLNQLMEKILMDVIEKEQKK
jgi:hypothetical protein